MKWFAFVTNDGLYFSTRMRCYMKQLYCAADKDS